MFCGWEGSDQSLSSPVAFICDMASRKPVTFGGQRHKNTFKLETNRSLMPLIWVRCSSMQQIEAAIYALNQIPPETGSTAASIAADQACQDKTKPSFISRGLA